MSISAKLRRLIEVALGDKCEADALVTAIDGAVAGTVADGGVTTAKIAAQAVTMPKFVRGTNGQLIVAQTGADPGYKTVSGDVTIDQNGVTAIGAQKVLMTMIARGTNGQLPIGQTGAALAYKTVTGDVTIDQDGVTALNANLKKQMVLIPIENLAADGDIASRVVFARSGGCTITGVAVIAQGDFVGVDDTNTVTISVKDGGGNTIASILLDDGTNGTIPTSNSLIDLGTPDVTNKVLTNNELVVLDIVCDGTADPPAMVLRLEFTPTNA